MLSKKVFNKHVIIAFAVTGVSVTESIYLEKQTGPVVKTSQTKTRTDVLIHGEQIRSLEVYLNERKPKYHRIHTTVDLFA